MRRLSTAMTGESADRLARHLLRPDGQEDVCFVLYRPSTGIERDTALVGDPILPGPNERHVHGNASFTSQYFLRALDTAEREGAGLALAHSHPGGCRWQGMSRDDIDAERGHAAQVWAMTGRPLLGLTLAGDGAWSARSWARTDRHEYARQDHGSVRVVDGQFRVTFNPHVLPPPPTDERMIRTVSAWGDIAQADLARLHVAVVGAGSVGVVVAEALARTGVGAITLLDFDSVKTHNLDRLAHATRLDALLRRSKVSVARSALLSLAPVDGLVVRAFEHSVVEPDGLRAVLDCDLIVSCVDRPWPRQVLDHAAFAHLIPVIDGGIRVSSTEDRLVRADWKAHIASSARRCLGCVGQYQPSEVALERAGDLDDPRYIEGLPVGHALKASENVYAFSVAVASLEMLQLLSMVLAPMDMADVGEWNFHFVTGRMDALAGTECEPYCPNRQLIGMGDTVDAPTGVHDAAAAERRLRSIHAHRPDVRLARFVSDASVRLRTLVEDGLTRWVASRNTRG